MNLQALRALRPTRRMAALLVGWAALLGGCGGEGAPAVGAAGGAAGPGLAVSESATASPCSAPANAIVAENCLTGSPSTEWDVSGAGDSTIQGFATQISVNRGETQTFKVATGARDYRLDIYRMGYYGGQGARKVATVRPSAALPQRQPSCLQEAATGLVDCGNWAVSASWTVPANAVSGIYFARAVRTDTGGASHIVFVVRDDAGTSSLLFQTADTTWQAYNRYGGNSLYVGSPAGRAYKVSYNRPFTTRAYAPEDWVFNAEYPMVRWLEANGYDVSYFAGIDTELRGSLLLRHKAFLSVAHDEYWSGAQRANVEAARNAGVHLAFLGGNDVFWKTRWENGGRTLVCYKETKANAQIDPAGPAVWTGTWRDPRFSPPADGGRPENGLTGTIFTVNASATLRDAITVSPADGRLRLWRNTGIASLPAGQLATLSPGTLGYEWNEDLDNGVRPAGLMRLSSTLVNNVERLLDYGSSYGPGAATHSLTMYRHASGALVFSAGTVQWSWALDGVHDRGGSVPDARAQQAMVNLLADMSAQPASLQPGLVPATASTDRAAPVSTIDSPAAGSTVSQGSLVTVSGTAADGEGAVAGVEVSVDGGATWRPASGREKWTYSWTPAAVGTATVKVRAVDDSGNLEVAGAGSSLTVRERTCPCSVWDDAVRPTVAADPETSALEVGMKFRSSVAGYVTGIRFYKGSGNGGTHMGNLWSSGGQRLASATFTSETASGWQQVSFATPVRIEANTVYVASYFAPQGRYSLDQGYFIGRAVTNAPLTALAHEESGGNGVYAYGSSSRFPNSTYRASNYWVDVVFATDASAPAPAAPTVVSTGPAAGATGVASSTGVTARFSQPMDATTITTASFELRDAAGATVSATLSYDAASFTATLTPAAALAPAASYSATVRGGSTDPRVKDANGVALVASVTWSFTTAAASQTACPCSLWPSSTVPTLLADPDTSAVELGVKFQADRPGQIVGLRFYKAGANGGTHVGSLWSNSGQLLGQATFTNETASGWQQVNFATPVAIQANTVYVASYFAPQGGYSQDAGYFASARESAPLRALRDGEAGANGLYRYSATPAFPVDTYQSANYWVDVVFMPNP